MVKLAQSALDAAGTLAVVEFGVGELLLRPSKTGTFWKSLQGSTRGVSQEAHPTAGESLKNPKLFLLILIKRC